MDQVSLDVNGQIVANGARRGLMWTSRSHCLTDQGDRIGTFPHHCHNRSRGDVLEQSGIKILAFVNRIMSFCEAKRHLDKFRGSQLQPAALEPPTDFRLGRAGGISDELLTPGPPAPNSQKAIRWMMRGRSSC